MTALPLGSAPIPASGPPRFPLPEIVLDADGTALRILRAWPDRRGTLSFEARDEDGRIRAGFADQDGGASVLPYGSDPGLPHLAEAAASGDVVVHRYKRRAVVRMRAGPAGPERYIKLLTGNKGTGIGAVSEATGALARSAGFAAPDVLAANAHTVVFSSLPGRSLLEIGTAPGDDKPWLAAWRRWRECWPIFVSTQPVHADDAKPAVAVHDAAAEAAALARWIDRALFWNALGDAEDVVRTLCADIAKDLTRSPGAGGFSLALSHRDLHDKHLLFLPETGRVGLLDFDTATCAEPALDLANLAVHLDLRVAQGLLPEGRRTSGRQAITDVARSLGVPGDRLRAYERSTRLRLACVYAFRPQWQALTRGWLTAMLPAKVEAS